MSEQALPDHLVRLRDAIRAGLAPAEAVAFADRCGRAVPAGADLSRVHHAFLARLLASRDPRLDVAGLAEAADLDLIPKAAGLHERAARGEGLPGEELWGVWHFAEAVMIDREVPPPAAPPADYRLAHLLRAACRSSASWESLHPQAAAWAVSRAAALFGGRRSARSRAAHAAMAEVLLDELARAPVPGEQTR